MKLFGIAVVSALVVVASPASALAAGGDQAPESYSVICVQVVTDAGQIGPKVCVPDPLQR